MNKIIPVGKIILAVFLFLFGLLIYRSVNVLSSDAISMAVGMLFGVLAGIPPGILILMAQRRGEQRREQHGRQFSDLVAVAEPAVPSKDMMVDGIEKLLADNGVQGLIRHTEWSQTGVFYNVVTKLGTKVSDVPVAQIERLLGCSAHAYRDKGEIVISLQQRGVA